jgi:hypothetical protein
MGGVTVLVIIQCRVTSYCKMIAPDPLLAKRMKCLIPKPVFCALRRPSGIYGSLVAQGG